MNDPDSVFIAGRHAVQGIGLSSPMCAEIPSESEKKPEKADHFFEKTTTFWQRLEKNRRFSYTFSWKGKF
ncbi:MAG: hypothetical protein IJT01_06510 [Selenomonadaceae bacterium]|nr:hypothetical protein [Selenomonadaceae bacterium]